MTLPRSVNHGWPTNQTLERWLEPNIFLTHFAGQDKLHEQLCDTIHRLSRDPSRVNHSPSRAIGSLKLYDLERWDCAAAHLVHQRAQGLFCQVLGKTEAVVDLSWATLYHDGDYCMPHSHPRTLAAILYMLDAGDSDDPASGRFCFADPRLKSCCREEAGYMSTPVGPELKAGTMLMFPGQIVHFVHTYRGTRPRITLSWNLNLSVKAGRPLPYQVKRG